MLIRSSFARLLLGFLVRLFKSFLFLFWIEVFSLKNNLSTIYFNKMLKIILVKFKRKMHD